MASIHDFDDKPVSYDLIRQAINECEFNSKHEAYYMLGFFKALELFDYKITGREIKKALEAMKDDSSDEIQASEADKFREKLEALLEQ